MNIKNKETVQVLIHEEHLRVYCVLEWLLPIFSLIALSVTNILEYLLFICFEILKLFIFASKRKSRTVSNALIKSKYIISTLSPSTKSSSLHENIWYFLNTVIGSECSECKISWSTKKAAKIRHQGKSNITTNEKTSFEKCITKLTERGNGR